MKPVRLAAIAEDELREARDWYELHAPGSGARLIAAVDAMIARIAEHPLHFPVVHADVRRALVPAMSYSIFFRDLPESIRVVAIVHQRRDPRAWKRRR